MCLPAGDCAHESSSSSSPALCCKGLCVTSPTPSLASGTHTHIHMVLPNTPSAVKSSAFYSAACTTTTPTTPHHHTHLPFLPYSLPLHLPPPQYTYTGTGKTTLAHVIARHCGFRVVEVNASDARTAASLTRAVTDAAEMAPVLDGEEADWGSGGRGRDREVCVCGCVCACVCLYFFCPSQPHSNQCSAGNCSQ